MVPAPGHLLFSPPTKVIKALLCLVIAWAMVSSSQAAPAPNTLKPIYWKQRLFFVPYQVNKNTGSLDQISKVQLMLSRNGSAGWYPLQEANTNVRGFSYHAPADGQYWFSLRHINSKGQPWPSAQVTAQLHIVIDTVKPTLKLEGSLGQVGAVAVRFEATDANLNPQSMNLEARTADGNWTRLSPVPDVSQQDRLVGHAEWSTPFGAKAIELRASISDHAGHQVQATSTVIVSGPSLKMPANNPSLQARQDASSPNNETVNPFQAASQMPAREWPANNQMPVDDVKQQSPVADSPPLRNPYTTASGSGASNKIPAQFAGDQFASAPGLLNESGQTANASAGNATEWNSPSVSSLDSSESAAGIRTVNSRTFEVEYDLESVGPWGVSKVELWGTHDNGQTWQSYGSDPDNRSPIRATVEGQGLYGFRILVDGANGLRAAPPRSGDQPELMVAVDLQSPVVQLQSATLGQGNFAGHLQIVWQATDANLEPRPIGLFYSAYPNGPWTTIASGLENTGSYIWRLGRQVPDQFFVRLEARDIAGNVATHQLSSPVTLSRPQPTGRLRAVRPVARPQGF